MIKVVTGVDIVYLPRFKKALKSGGENFLRRVFLESELGRHSPGVKPDHSSSLSDLGVEDLEGGSEHLAGIFASKEAVMKALGFPPGSWQDICIMHHLSGTPKVKLHTSHLILHTSSLSISHDGQYVIAQFVALLK